MMQAYEGRPTVVLPGSGGTITGTAVNEWLDEDGDPKFADEAGNTGDDAPDDASADKSTRERVERDKARNVELREAAAEENKGEA